ncbi:cobalamin biosynthesis protein [Methylocapsa aurea]|uniref:cobalamin biosynthesis protein n=1 Tax=Methylocapsa aurea TaxID=663610 RepID=UPI00068DC4FB|nr:cobalamin biosynthesis protein [Methylocapsa aurea]
MIAIGIGCKKGCPAQRIVALVRTARASIDDAGAPATLFTLADKQGETGLHDAAQELGLPLVFLDAEILRQASGRAITRSDRVMAMFGLPSIAETAALAGAGPASILLAPRVSEAGASCAIAGSREP